MRLSWWSPAFDDLLHIMDSNDSFLLELLAQVFQQVVLLILFGSRIAQEDDILMTVESSDNWFVDFISALSVVLLKSLHFDFEFIAVWVCPNKWREEEFKTFFGLKLSVLIEEEHLFLPVWKGVEELLNGTFSYHSNGCLRLRHEVEYSPSIIR